jgi:hypothetical protein
MNYSLNIFVNFAEKKYNHLYIKKGKNGRIR